MQKRIVFILTSTINTNSIKRVDEFVERGYDVKVYGFNRSLQVPNNPQNITIDVIGSFENNLSYSRRCGIFYKGIKRVLSENKGSHCVYYLIGMDVAIFFRLQSREPYIYEEADLVHIDTRNNFAKSIGERIDKSIIKHSVLSVFRSEGFVKYHFGEKMPDNVCVISNRLNTSILKFDIFPKGKADLNHLKIGYVGFIRYDTIAHFAKVFCSEFPQHEIHFYGTFTSEANKRKFVPLEGCKNCYFHGPFKSPDELNVIYSRFDMVLSTYDVSSENVRYAEPNKIYEAIYFETPIIVSSDTYLADKVNRLGIGFDVNPMDDKAVCELIRTLNSDRLQKAIDCTKKIEKKDVININDDFFEKLNKSLN